MTDGSAAEPRIVRNERAQWINFHHNVTQKIRGIYDVYNPATRATLDGYRRTAAAIQGLVAEARRDGTRLRALGSGWSLSRAPATDGWLLNIKPLNWVFRVTSAESVDPGYAGDRESLLLVQCGTSVAELNRYLETRLRRSLRTSGASNGQTFVGAMATGTHGSAIDVGAIQDHVVGLHLLAGADRQVWLERASYPVASRAFAGRLGVELIRDDTLFDAALVSFGSFGVIHSVMIETGERFLLEAYRRTLPFDAALKAAIDTLDFSHLPLPVPSTRPYFVQVVINPHDLGRGAPVDVMYRRPAPEDYEPNYAIEGGLRPGHDVLSVVGTVTDAIPDLTPLLVNQALRTALVPFGPEEGTFGETFDYTTLVAHATGAAVAVPVADTSRALETLLAVHERVGPAPIAFGCRFVQRSNGLLAFTRYDPSCAIDLDGVRSRRSTEFFRAVWPALEEAGIPHTEHWGKVNGLTRSRLRAMYGDDLDRWVASRRTLLADPAERQVFSNAFIERLGLAD